MIKRLPPEKENVSPVSKGIVKSVEVSEALDRFEAETVRDTGVVNISGGFARAEASEDEFDSEHWNVELTWGIQSDCENVRHVENYKMNKKTYQITEV